MNGQRFAFNDFLANVQQFVPRAPFQRSLLTWYRRNGRNLPWRQTKDPYSVLVSEFMLQQTQVKTVIPRFVEWMQRFPDFKTLAAAEEKEVLQAWEGLGYYSRARHLHDAARTVIEKHGGGLPFSPKEIRDLPGVGRYTANAVETFAFDRAVPIVEANISRILSRLMNLTVSIDSVDGRKALWCLATSLLPRRNAGVYNSALMDLGALVCRRRPACMVCPVQSFCRAENPSQLPIRKARPVLELLTERHGFCKRKDHVLLEQSQQRWRQMWILPRLTTVSDKETPLHISEFPFTNHRVTLIVFTQKNKGNLRGSHRRWFAIDELPSLPIPSPHRRALKFLTGAKPSTLHAANTT
jgi:A/G-specific adenine glycosylase